MNVTKGDLQAWLESSKARRKRRNTAVLLFGILLGALCLVGLGAFFVFEFAGKDSRGVPGPNILESALKSALGKPAHGMTFQQFKSRLNVMGPALVKGVGNNADHFLVDNEGVTIKFIMQYTDAYEVEKDVSMFPSRGYYGTREQPVFVMPYGEVCGYKANFLATFGEPDLMAAKGTYLRFEYQLRGGKVTLSVFAPYWHMGVFWVRSLNYEGAYSD